MESWIANERRKICKACTLRPTCTAVKDGKLWFEDAPACPEKKLHTRADYLRWERAWPSDVPPVSGCCDPP